MKQATLTLTSCLSALLLTTTLTACGSHHNNNSSSGLINVTDEAPDISNAWNAQVYKDSDGNLTIKAQDKLVPDTDEKSQEVAGFAIAETNTTVYPVCVTVITPDRNDFWCKT